MMLPLLAAGCVNAAVQATGGGSAPATPALSASACPSAGALGSRYAAPIPASGALDQGLFDAAVLHHTNVARCARGLGPLAADPALLRAARVHSGDMVARGFFAHSSPVAGRRTLEARLKGENARFRRAAENIAYRSRLQVVSGRPFYVIDRGRCLFSYQQGGEPVAAHTYDSMAERFVDLWAASPQHSRNLFNPAYRRLGSGAAFDPDTDTCGDVYATQNFAA